MLGSFSNLIRTGMSYAMPGLAFRLHHKQRNDDEIELDILPALVDPAREAIDVGAYIGRYTMPLSHLATRVHAFEPHPRLAFVLNTAFRDNVSVYQMAVSDMVGTLALSTPLVDGFADEGVSRVGGFDEAIEQDQFVVESMMLDELVDEPIGFIKIDVEGHELSVLEGARHLIAVHQPVILVEVEDRHRFRAIDSVRQFMTAHGYAGFFVHQGKMNEIAAFRNDMQDGALLRAIQQGLERRRIPYVNNFVFISEKADIFSILNAANQLLATVSETDEMADFAPPSLDDHDDIVV